MTKTHSSDKVVISPSDLERLIKSAETIIDYSPLGNEPDTTGVLKPFADKLLTIPPNKTADPFKLAAELRNKYSEHSSVVVLVPGQKFDQHGNRHGRGGGWYDRFLSAIPQPWIKVGICQPPQLSETKLETNPWDIEMDCIFVLTQ